MNSPSFDESESVASAKKKMGITPNEGPTSIPVAKSDEMRDEKSVCTDVSHPSSAVSLKDDHKIAKPIENDNDAFDRQCVSEDSCPGTPVSSTGDEYKDDKNKTSVGNNVIERETAIEGELVEGNLFPVEKNHNDSSNEMKKLESKTAAEEIESKESTINLLGISNDEQQRQYSTSLQAMQEEKELNEAVAELTSAIENNPNLSKVQKQFFLELAADPEGTNGGSIASYDTQSSIQSLRKATDFIQDDLKERERLSRKKKALRAPKKITRETTVHENLWKAHANRIAPKTVLDHVRASDDNNSIASRTRRKSASSIQGKFKGMANKINDEHNLRSSMSAIPVHSKMREITIDDIATPKRSNIQADESNKRLSAGGGAEKMGLVMPGLDDDDDDVYGADDTDYQIDFPEGFNKNEHDNYSDDMGSITDSLLTDDENYDNSLLDGCYDNEECLDVKPAPTVLFSNDRLPSSLSSIIRRAGEDDDDDSLVEKAKKPKPILRNSQYSNNDESSVASSVRKRHARQSSCPSIFLKPEIREDFGAGFEVIAQGYHFDDASVADTASLGSYHPWTDIMAKRGSCSSQFSIPSLHRCDAEEEQSLISSIRSISGDESYASARGRTLSCPETRKLLKQINVSNNALGDDLTALDDASVVSFKKVSFSNVSVETEEKYPQVKEETVDDKKESPATSTEVSESKQADSNEEIKVSQYLNDDNDSDNCSWSIATMETKDMQYDAWDLFKDDYVKDQIDLPFEIFGTSATDVSSMPHVLSPPLIDSLRHFIPDRLFHNNLWMKYSLVRDGASLSILLRNIRGSQSTLLAIETTEGDVFGCFTSTPWKTQYGYFGTGESFVWKMKQRRGTKCYSLLDQVQMESEVEVFAFSNENDMVQVCKQDFIAVGGGTLKDSSHLPDLNLNDVVSDVEAGFALALDEELLNGTSSPCATFLSPCLTDSSSPTGEVFEVVNMEVWTFTPCSTEEQAERNELGKMFRDGNTDMDVIGTYIGGNGFGGSGKF